MILSKIKLGGYSFIKNKKFMYIDDPELQKKKAEATKKKWEAIVFGDELYECRKCGVKKHPKDFVIQRLDNPWVGKYRYLYECKECKRNRTYKKRSDDRGTIEGALNIISKQLQQGAKKRDIKFEITVDDLLDMREKQDGKCYYTGYEMTYGFVHYNEGSQSDKTKYQVSCDRLDNSIGYKRSNVVLCCTVANKMKNTMSEKEFYQICSDISTKHK
ncbi:MAG TPA: hypothetical protein VJ892_02175 [Candidatus Absconditabacterales bacterium]|nr:hypothetical protein [Candidatus Absconditabacterales bacterium]